VEELVGVEQRPEAEAQEPDSDDAPGRGEMAARLDEPAIRRRDARLATPTAIGGICCAPLANDGDRRSSFPAGSLIA
jgi:hypothetical protein